jgi:UDPglucose 6-dehydrogenase
MRICVVGCGYVGLVAAACFAELGHDVLSVDNDSQKICDLNCGISVIHEEHLQQLLSRHRGSRLTFSTSLEAAIHDADIIFIAVGTPSASDGSADLSYVESVARTIALSSVNYKIVVEKSTVPVYTSGWIRRAMLLNGRKTGDFDVVSNPEFLREGSAVTDFLYPDRIVVGATSARAHRTMKQLYQPLLDGSYRDRQGAIPNPADARPAPLYVETSPQSAELIKHASNAFLAMKISFINAVANICELAGADIEEVCQGIGSDRRIGSGFLRAGIGYGGSCFPKDVSAFGSVANDLGYDFRLLHEVSNINKDQRERFIRKIRMALWTLRGKRLGILGLAFKAGTDDVRESPALEIVKRLADEGCIMRAYDPAAMERASRLLANSVEMAPDPYSAAQNADALLILTDWPEFAELDLEKLKTAVAYPIVLDGRNLYDPKQMAEAGFSYYSVGRGPVDCTDTVLQARSLAALG